MTETAEENARFVECWIDADVCVGANLEQAIVARKP